jgi:myo-inositol-1(or 4)-monophosphatase
VWTRPPSCCTAAGPTWVCSRLRGRILVAVVHQQAALTGTGPLLAAAARAMDTAADMARHHGSLRSRSKGDRDMVTDLDVEIERAVRASLHHDAPHVAFLGEEESSATGTRELTWALDPIDGTANLIHGLPLFAISLALVRDDSPILGMIDPPALRQRYSAVRGQGAFLNGEPIQVGDGGDLADAMVTVGDYAVGQDAGRRNELRLAVTGQLARKVLRVRMLGSAAIDLAWLAEGKTDACIIVGSHPWDIAAGVIIATEAGAKIVDLDGSAHTLRARATIAAPPALIDGIVHLIAEAQAREAAL